MRLAAARKLIGFEGGVHVSKRGVHVSKGGVRVSLPIIN